MRHIGALTVLLVAATLTGCDSGDGTDGENRPTASTTASTSAEPSVALTPQQARSTLLVRANLGARWKKEAPWSFLPGCTDLPESPLLMLPVAAQAEIAWTLPEGPKVEQAGAQLRRRGDGGEGPRGDRHSHQRLP
ncbi:hypothetical protein G5V59_14860 [Nocardioides sp. W3-2-3]|uniref:hypothetical protein n=1 Tax=Nocardioides convexus TaxID=2712224 RepID=UPI00241819AD|nr:hypothetical protein [Nocardioides convexus]NHA00797.1 hypothetical protein [Nocardioides convexus]